MSTWSWKKCHQVTSKKKNRGKYRGESRAMLRHTPAFPCGGLPGCRTEANCWAGSYGHQKHLPVIRGPGEMAQGGETNVASDSGEVRALIRFLWGDSSKRPSCCDLGLLRGPGMQPGVTKNTPERWLSQSETCQKIKIHSFKGVV